MITLYNFFFHDWSLSNPMSKRSFRVLIMSVKTKVGKLNGRKLYFLQALPECGLFRTNVQIVEPL